MKTGLSSVESPSRLGLIEGEVSKIIAFQGNRTAGSKSRTNTSGMTAGDEFSESNNLKVQGETYNTDRTGIPVVHDKVSYTSLCRPNLGERQVGKAFLHMRLAEKQ